MRLAIVVVSLLVGRQAIALQNNHLVGSVVFTQCPPGTQVNGGACPPLACCNIPQINDCDLFTNQCCEPTPEACNVGTTCCSGWCNFGTGHCGCDNPTDAINSCWTQADCCPGASCNPTTGKCCGVPGVACNAAGDCCSGNCQSVNGHNVCICDSPGGSPDQCVLDIDCCLVTGARDCDNGTCAACSNPGGACTDATDCCYTATSECISNKCCAEITGQCTENANCCASNQACVSGECCGDKGATCGAGAPCCAGSTCGAGNVCTCIADNSIGCRQTSDCCSPLETICKTPTHACSSTDENCYCEVVP